MRFPDAHHGFKGVVAIGIEPMCKTYIAPSAQENF